jgi:hypothetical protein
LGSGQHTADTSAKTKACEVGGRTTSYSASHSTSHPAPEAPADPDLAALVSAWSDLPPAVRAGIVALVKAVEGPAE